MASIWFFRAVPEKVLAGMRWATGLPINWLYASIDDDLYVNHNRLVSYFNKLITKYIRKNGRINFYKIPIVCVYSYQERDFPSRDIKSKWYVSKKDYPGLYWPKYCRGGMYTANIYMVKNLLKVSTKVPLLQMDDVWITGLMRVKVKNDDRTIVVRILCWVC